MVAVILILQPIFSLMMITETKLRNILVLIYSIIVIPYLLYKYFHINLKSLVSKNGNLRWNFLVFQK
jgi:hypothetical protein